MIVRIKKEYPGFILDVDFESEDKSIGILGPSGSGKSLTLKCIAGLEKPDAGKIVVDGRIFFDSDKGIDLSPAERRVGFIFQDYALFPHMTVAENVGFGVHRLSAADRIKKVRSYLEKVHLNHVEHLYPGQLSGGQQQRIAIARAMITEPDILLLDESFSALDIHLRYEMEMQFRELMAEFGRTSVFVSHDIKETYRISDCILVYNKGKVIAQGDKQRLFVNPQYKEVARITGCKNILAVLPEADGKYRVPELGVVIQADISDQRPQYIGIRAHHIYLWDDSMGALSNVFRCKIVQVIESPFEIAILLAFEAGERTLRWETARENWERISADKEVVVYIPKDKVILMQA